ncbi:MAG: RHS repeat-associated core domain-containing protein, partial [Candidatus Acidiferrum sp.]
MNFTFDGADRPQAATDGSNGITYATGQASPPTGCSSSGVCYTPQGTEYGAAIGKTSTFDGINLSETYNSRLQPLEIKASSSGGNAFDISYSFADPATGGNAGHVYSISNNLNGSRSQSFSYDSLNRIVNAGTTATSGTYCWGYQYDYDAWANLKDQLGWSPNYNGCSEATMATVTADGNNHISGFTYDKRGNTQNDGSIDYTYDAESQIKSAAGVTYSYDGSGRRVSKSNGKLYWYDAGSEILAETDASGNTLNEYIFFGGKRVAVLPAGGNPEYYAEDFLGSSRVMTQNNGTVCYDADFDPYGGEHPYINTCSSNVYKFEGKERDTETGNDDFGARYYTSRFGRWLSADWSSTPAPVPYANLTNPQTLNLYAMVSDDPESFADLDGHCPPCDTDEP